MSIITPSVQAMSVNEWPEPATFTSMRSGAQRCSLAQLVQVGN
jgi:hypothetical protein